MDNEGEGKVTPPVWIRDNTKASTATNGKYESPTNSEQAISSKKPIVSQQKKFLGIPTWTWLVAGAILVFAVFAVLIVMATR